MRGMLRLLTEAFDKYLGAGKVGDVKAFLAPDGGRRSRHYRLRRRCCACAPPEVQTHRDETSRTDQ